MRGSAGKLLAGLLLAVGLVPSLAAAQGSPAIYSCIDAKGRKLTADRPIRECADREQQLLNPSGTVRATITPALTGQERVALEARKRREAAEQARQAEEKRRERALLLRYPNQEMHDKEREEALSQIHVVKQAALQRVTELERQRRGLETELEFFQNDIEKAPPSLKRQFADNEKSQDVQARFIAEQDAEIARVNARFDEELERLKQLWTQIGAAN